MEWQAYVLAVFFALAGLLCVALVPVGLPGTWALIGLAFLVEVTDRFALRTADPVTFGTPLLVLAVGLAVVGEIIEGVAGAAGTRMGGGTRRGMVGAFVGGIVGAIVFTPLIPIPLVGTLIGAVVGTFVGAWVGEASAEQARHRNENLRAAMAAALGRIAGTFGKTMVATVVWVLLVRGAFLA